MSIINKLILFPLKLFPQYLAWRNSTLQFLFKIKRLLFIGPSPEYKMDIKQIAKAKNWKYISHTPFIIQKRLPSLALMEDMLDIVRRGNKLASGMYESIMAFSKARGEMYYSHLHSVTNYPIYETFTCEIPRATLFVETGEVISEDYELFPQANQLQVTPQRYITREMIENLPVEKGTYVSMLDHFSQNYTHWLVDCLPKLSLIDLANEDIKILVPREMIGYQKDSLEILGVKEDRFVSPKDQLIKVENLIISHPNQNCGVPHFEHLTKIIEKLKAPFKDGIPEAKKRVYISRSRARRKIVNEDELIPLLKRYNFEIVHAEDLSLREQIKLFSQTNVLVGPHGAGIINHIFCAPGATVIQIFNEKRWEHLVCRTTSLLKQKHWHMFAKNMHKNFDTWVDKKKLKKLLDYAIENKSNSYDIPY